MDLRQDRQRAQPRAKVLLNTIVRGDILDDVYDVLFFYLKWRFDVQGGSTARTVGPFHFVDERRILAHTNAASKQT
jgi:hypothetical protein